MLIVIKNHGTFHSRMCGSNEIRRQHFEDRTGLPKPKTYDCSKNSPETWIATLQLVIGIGVTWLASCFQGFEAFCSRPATAVAFFVVFLGTVIASMFPSHQTLHDFDGNGNVGVCGRDRLQQRSPSDFLHHTVLIALAPTFGTPVRKQSYFLLCYSDTFLAEFVISNFIFARSEYLLLCHHVLTYEKFRCGRLRRIANYCIYSKLTLFKCFVCSGSKSSERVRDFSSENNKDICVVGGVFHILAVI